MKHVMRSAIVAVLLVLPGVTANAIVIRHDLPDSRYRVKAAEFPMIAYLPGEGQGVLISKQWVLSAAHAVVWRPVHEVSLNGVSRSVAEVLVHPGYKAPPERLKTGDAAPLMAFMASSDDIALIKLRHSVVDVTPARVYRGGREEGRIVEIVGRGATGNGLVGQYPHSPHSGQLRRAYGRVISADQRWLGLSFDPPPMAMDLEGMPADGDSGAPIFIQADGIRQLAGLVSRKLATGRLSAFQCCHYGQITYQVRVSRYAAWIDATIGN